MSHDTHIPPFPLLSFIVDLWRQESGDCRGRGLKFLPPSNFPPTFAAVVNPVLHINGHPSQSCADVMILCTSSVNHHNRHNGNISTGEHVLGKNPTFPGSPSNRDLIYFMSSQGCLQSSRLVNYQFVPPHRQVIFRQLCTTLTSGYSLAVSWLPCSDDFRFFMGV